MKKLLLCFAVFAAACLSAQAYTIKNDPLLKAMKTELDRSFKNLKNAEKVPMYYLSYQITDMADYRISAADGGITGDSLRRNRTLDIDVRVGSPKLDNTHQIKGDMGNRYSYGKYAHTLIALNSEEKAVRTAIWELTDLRYKEALEDYQKVKANMALTAAEEDDSDDFSFSEKVEFYEDVPAPQFNREEWKTRLKELSAFIAKDEVTMYSGVYFNIENDVRYFVNTEGSVIKTGNNYISLHYSAIHQAEDGMNLRRSKSYHARTVEELPSNEEIKKDMEQSLKELNALKNAPLVEPYHGPVILKNQASGVFFHEIFGHRVEGHRQKDVSEGQTFAKKMNMPVVSEIVSVVDDPTMASFKGIMLRGYYKYDDEGVKAQKAPLIEDGILKGFLMSRSPIAAAKKSNGHGRKSRNNKVVARMGNTIVTVKNPVPYEELRAMLIKEIKRQGKEYGLVFEDIEGGFTTTRNYGAQAFKVLPLLVYRVYADGRPDEVVRGVDIVGTPLASFNKIAAGADDDGIFNGTCGAESGWVPVSAVAPSLLVTELEVQKVNNPKNMPPILSVPKMGERQ